MTDCFRVELISVVLYVMIDIRFWLGFLPLGAATNYILCLAMFARFAPIVDPSLPPCPPFFDFSFGPVNLLFQPLHSDVTFSIR